MKVSGQRINMTKSSIFFSKNMQPTRCLELAQQFGMSINTGSGKYLGLPYLIGRSKAKIISYMKENLEKGTWLEREAVISLG